MVEVWPPCQPYYEAFFALAGARTYGGGGMGGAFPHGLSYADVSAYARDHGYRPGPDLSRFLALIQALDQEYIAQWKRKAGSK